MFLNPIRFTKLFVYEMQEFFVVEIFDYFRMLKGVEFGERHCAEVCRTFCFVKLNGYLLAEPCEC